MTKLYKHSEPQSRYEHLLGIVLLVAFLLPHSSILFQLVNPILCVLMVFIGWNRKWNPFVMMVVIPIVISLVLNIQMISQKALLSTATILLYFICFPFVGKAKINNIYIYICCGYIVVSQFVYLLGVPFLTNFFDTTYPIGENDTSGLEYMRNSLTYSNILDYRLGGLYHNSNDCSRSLTMLLAFFIVMNQGNRKRIVLLFSFFVFAAILLTGSRTGFIISVLILYFGLLRNKSYPSLWKFLFFAIAIIGIGYIIGSGASFRGMDVESGFYNSANLKWNTFIYYLTNESSVSHLLFGHIDASLFQGQFGVAMNNFDSEYGSLVFRFGVIGFLCILLYYWEIIKRIDKSKWFFFFILLWMISSTIMASYRASFFFLLLTSVVYSNNRVAKYF